MVLTTLQGNEDHSPAKQSYDSSNHVLLPVDEHIRFDTPEYRIPESLKVVAVSSATGTIHTLLKSYDVNNEFFVKLEPGDYQFRVQATWSELGTNVYVFDVTVSE